MTKASKARLTEILRGEVARKYPNVNPAYAPITIYPDVNEKGIKKNIKQICDALGIKYTNTDSKAKMSVSTAPLHHATGITRNHVTTHFRKSEFEKGHHDIEISRNNQLWCVEIKAQNEKTKYKDRQSDVQKEYEIKLKDRFGNDYYIIHGIDDFFKLLDTHVLI